jgi:glycosyltransferase involved in cell wall biosynthesis
MSRVVMFVYNDVSRDSRVLKEAASLAAAGHDVRVIGRWRGADTGVPMSEESAGFQISRVPGPELSQSLAGMIFTAQRSPILAAGRFRRRLLGHLRDVPSGWPKAAALLAGGFALAPFVALGLVRFLLGRPPDRSSSRSGIAYAARWLVILSAWGHEASRAAGPADIYHAHDLTGLPAARGAQRKWGGRLVYDSHELFLETGAVASRGIPHAAMRWLEGHWIRQADAVITVNDSIANELKRRYRPRRLIVIHNVPPLWTSPDGRPDLLRHAAGIPEDDLIALYHGGFQVNRGIEQIADAILEPGLERVHLVLLGHGPLRDRLVELAAEVRYGGRIHVLESVPPAELLPWVASADLGLALTQPSTLNNRLSSPNKMFETIATGTPIVMSDFPEMRRVIRDDPAGSLGALCDPTDPRAIARAIRSIVELSATERQSLRARCLTAARERWNWERESVALVGLYETLRPGALDRESPGS